MRSVHWMGKALLAGSLALVLGSCAGDKHKCTCNLKNDITNTETVTTEQSCATLAEQNTDIYTSCFQASGSILGPSWPITLQIRKPYEFPTELIPGQGEPIKPSSPPSEAPAF